jgi:hypothetical protein
VTNVKLLVANDKTGFKALTLKDLSESSKINRQPISKCGTKFKEQTEIQGVVEK